MTDDIWEREAPFTVGHKLGIVCIHSYTAMLKPSRTTTSVRKYKRIARALKFTVGFLVVMQISERVEVHIAMKRHMRPIDASATSTPGTAEDILDAPIPSVGKDQLLLVKRSRLEPAHVSISDEVVSNSRRLIGIGYRLRDTACGNIKDCEGVGEMSRGQGSPPYTMFCFTRASLPAFALSSSIQSGWNQSS